jgi:hypothetical protein
MTVKSQSNFSADGQSAGSPFDVQPLQGLMTRLYINNKINPNNI